MSKIGKVFHINQNRGMVAISTISGFTIIELLDEWDLDIGDTIFWKNDYGLGSEIYKNISKNNIQEVYVQNHDVSQNHVFQQLLYPEEYYHKFILKIVKLVTLKF